MCGIIGAYSIKRELDLDLGVRLDQSLKMLKHRGPDCHRSEIINIDDKTITFGHARLSIIDLTLRADQPMTTIDRRFSIVFNGEIYNYLELRELLKNDGFFFKTHSDTEVLLAAWEKWGENCLHRLVGMFAFVILDRTAKTLTLVRDGFGIKPLFIAQSDHALYFSSELPALINLRGSGANLNLQRSYDYLMYGDYDTNHQTFVEGINQLSPGCIQVLNISNGSLTSPRHWWKPSVVQSCSLSFEKASTRLRDMFLENIKLHLRSDVPLGAALSGGIDSSSVVCAIRHIEPDLPINTFSYIAKDSMLSEEKWVDLVNQSVNAKAHKIVVEPSELLSDLDDMIVAQGEPFGSTSIYAQYRVFKLAKDNGVTVTLDGQGADEILAGYNGYPGKRVRSILADGDVTGALSFLYSWSKWPGRSISYGMKLAGAELLDGRLYQLARKQFKEPDSQDWINKSLLHEKGVNLIYPIKSSDVSHKNRNLIAALIDASTNNGLPTLLRHADRNSMRFSVESRVPFLTQDLAEFLFSLPEDYLISKNGETKSIFRVAMRGIVPDEILDRRDKIGFATPEFQLLKNAFTSNTDWILEDEQDLSFLRHDVIRKRFHQVFLGEVPFTSQVWRWINFYRWYQLVIQPLKIQLT
jgi:asparagine synthase (glutamine-hydrolysing)